MKTMYKVSVIIPIYNCEQYLTRCIESVLNQSLKDIEVILACDGPEACDIICRNYAASDDRIKILGHCGSYGKSVNCAIDKATGKYIGSVEADDWISPKMYEVLYEVATVSNADICKAMFTSCYATFQKDSKEYLAAPSEVFDVSEFPQILACQPSVWSAIYNKNFLDKFALRFVEDKISYIDSPFQLECLLRASRIAVVKTPLYNYNLDNPLQSVKDTTKVLDGIIADSHLLEKIDLSSLPYSLYTHIMLAFIRHLAWHYTRFTSYTDRKIFWAAAHSFVKQAHCRSYDCDNLSFAQKIFFRLLKTYDKYWKAAAPMAAASYMHRIARKCLKS